jgi:hypothetical protein
MEPKPKNVRIRIGMGVRITVDPETAAMMKANLANPDPEYVKMKKETDKVHRVWHKFERFLVKTFGKDYHKEMIGYEAMQKVEKYVESNPQITITFCDDAYYSSSILVIVPHPNHGNTVFFMPQCTTHQNHFFLYPSHQKMLMEALTKHTHPDRYAR